MTLRRTIFTLCVSATLLLSPSCSTPAAVQAPAGVRVVEPTIVPLGADFAAALPEWAKEFRWKYRESGCVLVGAHGADILGHWFVMSDQYGILPVEKFVDRVRDAFPTDRLVLIVCNPAGVVLDAPKVTYALTNVWMIPDSATIPREFALLRILSHGDYAGDVSDFVENP